MLFSVHHYQEAIDVRNNNLPGLLTLYRVHVTTGKAGFFLNGLPNFYLPLIWLTGYFKGDMTHVNTYDQ